MYWENILEMWFYECIYFWFPGNWTNTTSKSLENNTRWTSFATTNGRTDIIPPFQECGSFCCSKGSVKMYYCCVLLFLNYLRRKHGKIKLEKKPIMIGVLLLLYQTSPYFMWAKIVSVIFVAIERFVAIGTFGAFRNLRAKYIN